MPIVEDEALQSMLMAWYYSGYYTGRYQALKELEEQRVEHEQAKKEREECCEPAVEATQKSDSISEDN